MITTGNFFENLESASTWSTGVAFKRTNPLPLDRYSVFKSIEELEDYIKTHPVAYPGQIVTVYNSEDTFAIYVIESVGVDGIYYQLPLSFVSGARLNIQRNEELGSITFNHAQINKPTIHTGSGRTYITKINTDDYGHITDYETASEIDQDLSNYYTKDETNALVSTGLIREIVDVLPEVSDAKDNTIYLVPTTSPIGLNSYDEYLVINNKFELIGNTSSNNTTALEYQIKLLNAKIVNLEERLEALENGQVGITYNPDTYELTLPTTIASVEDSTLSSNTGEVIDNTLEY